MFRRQNRFAVVSYAAVQQSAKRAMSELLESRRLLAAVSWDGGASDNNWSSAQNWSTNLVPNSSDQVTIAGAPTVNLPGSVHVDSLTSNATLLLPGTSLRTNLALVNTGTIELNSTAAAADSGLHVGTLLTNASAGVIRAIRNNGGTRFINGGSITNSGSIEAQSLAALIVSLPASQTFLQQAGSVTASGTNSEVRFEGFDGKLSLVGGTLSGFINNRNCKLDIAASFGASTIFVTRAGQSDSRLINNLSTSATIAIQGRSGYSDFNNGVLRTLPDAVNNGTILLESFVISSDAYLAVAENFTNNGTIRARAGAGGTRYVDGLLGGTITNNGAVEVQSSLLVVRLPESATFTHAGGALSVTGSTSELRFEGVSGTIALAAGSLSGFVNNRNCRLDIAASFGAHNIFVTRAGQSNARLVNNLSAQASITVQGRTGYSDFNDGVLVTLPDAVNNGTIVLESALINSDAKLFVAENFTNNGTIRSRAGSGGTRYITGVAAGNLITNTGSVETSNSLLVVSLAASSVFAHQSGLLSATGSTAELRFEGVDGTMNLIGGSLSGFVNNRNCRIDIEGTFGSANLFVTRLGQSNARLVKNLATQTTITVLGRTLYSDFNDGVLVTLPDAVNNGTILLTSSVISANAYLYLSGDFMNNGAIRATIGTGGARFVDQSVPGVSFTNSGTIEAVGVPLAVRLQPSGQFRHSVGSLSAIGSTGELRFEGADATLNFVSGTASGFVNVRNCKFAIEATFGANTIYVTRAGQSSARLVNNLSSLAQIVIQGRTGYSDFNDGVLVAQPDAVNNGTIVLESVGISAAAYLYYSANFVNSGTIRSVFGAGGGRTIEGGVGASLTNSGSIVAQQIPVTVNGTITNFTGTTLTGGTWTADEGNLSLNSVSTAIRSSSATLTQRGAGRIFRSGGNSVFDLNATFNNTGTINLENDVDLLFFTQPAGGTQPQFRNAGTLRLSAGSELSAPGGYVQLAAGVLRTQLRSDTEYGRISAPTIALAGRLEGQVVDGYEPPLGTTFLIAGGGSRTGTFATFIPFSTDSGRPITLGYTSSAAVLTASTGDGTAPSVVDASFNFATSPNTLDLFFSENVQASIQPSDFYIRNETLDLIVDVADLLLSYDVATDRLRISFANIRGGVLPNGVYSLSAAAGSFQDPTGNLSAAYTFTGPPAGDSFFMLTGDANRDGRVEFDDLLALAQNYAQTGRTWSQGDFDYNGKVDFADLLILAQNYGQSLNVLGAGPQVRRSRRTDRLTADLLL